jgi:predicted DNA-binding protein (MmcQ/YjbR family)
MTPQAILDYALTKNGAYLDFPFGMDYPVIKVKAPEQKAGRIFVQLFELKGEPKVTYNCTWGNGLLYRELYEGKVVRGWHCPPIMQPYMNTVTLDGSVSDEVLLRMCDESYSYVLTRMPRYIRQQLQK